MGRLMLLAQVGHVPAFPTGRSARDARLKSFRRSYGRVRVAWDLPYCRAWVNGSHLSYFMFLLCVTGISCQHSCPGHEWVDRQLNLGQRPVL